MTTQALAAFGLASQASQQPPAEPLLYKVAEAARMLAISPRALWTLTRAGKVRSVKLGASVRYTRRDLEEYVARQREVTKVQEQQP